MRPYMLTSLEWRASSRKNYKTSSLIAWCPSINLTPSIIKYQPYSRIRQPTCKWGKSRRRCLSFYERINSFEQKLDTHYRFRWCWEAGWKLALSYDEFMQNIIIIISEKWAHFIRIEKSIWQAERGGKNQEKWNFAHCQHWSGSEPEALVKTCRLSSAWLQMRLYTYHSIITGEVCVRAIKPSRPRTHALELNIFP